MGTTDRELTQLLDRAAARRLSERDMQRLGGAIDVRGTGNVVLNGKYNVRMGQGRNIHFGDRIYTGYSAENVREAIQEALRHHSGDEIGPLHGVSGLVITVGVLIALLGAGLFGYGVYRMVSAPFDSLAAGPPAVVFQGFGLTFAGIVVGNVGRLMRAWHDGRR